MMRKGKLTGALGIDVHDYLVDEIGNESRTVWNGLIPATHDTYPVDVNEYAGVFYVWAMEYDDVGYFLSLDAAKGYVYGNWEGVEPAEP